MLLPNFMWSGQRRKKVQQMKGCYLLKREGKVVIDTQREKKYKKWDCLKNPSWSDKNLVWGG